MFLNPTLSLGLCLKTSADGELAAAPGSARSFPARSLLGAFLSAQPTLQESGGLLTGAARGRSGRSTSPDVGRIRVQIRPQTLALPGRVTLEFGDNSGAAAAFPRDPVSGSVTEPALRGFPGSAGGPPGHRKNGLPRLDILKLKLKPDVSAFASCPISAPQKKLITWDLESALLSGA